MLRSRKLHREESAGLDEPAPTASHKVQSDPEQEALLADSVGLALLVVLDRLTPGERVAFVLHDMFDLTFEEIAPIVGRTPAAARQLASRGRRRVRGAGSVPDPDRARQRKVVDAFLAAARSADFEGLLAVLDPEVVLRADSAAVQAAVSSGAAPLASEIRGASAVGKTFTGRARAAQPWLVSGAVGLVLAPGGVPRVAFRFATARGRITQIDVIADPEHIRQLDLSVLTD